MAKRHASVLHEEDIGSRCVGGTITKKMSVAPPVIGDFERYSTIGQIVGTRTTSANDVFGLIGNGREPSLDVVGVVADGANGIVRHNGKGAIEGGHRRDTDKETGDALRTAVGFERCARQGGSGASSQSGEQILSGIVGDETPRTGIAHGVAEGGRSTDGGEAQESGQRGKTALRVVAARGECAPQREQRDEEAEQAQPFSTECRRTGTMLPGKRAFEHGANVQLDVNENLRKEGGDAVGGFLEVLLHHLAHEEIEFGADGDFHRALISTLREQLHPHVGADGRTFGGEFHQFGFVTLYNGEGDVPHLGIGRKGIFREGHIFEITAHFFQSLGRDLPFRRMLQDGLQAFGIGKGLFDDFETTQIGHASVGFGLCGVEGVDL